MKMYIGRTWSGPDCPHRTLMIITSRWYVHVWVHAFERGWWFVGEGMRCFGAGWISFNLFNIGRAA